MSQQKPAAARPSPAFSFLNDRRVRDVLSQILVVGGLVAVVWYFVGNARENMVRGGIASGFDFLWVNAGIDLPMKLIDYGPASTYARMLLVGVLNTLLVSVIGIVLATILGFVIGIARLSRNWLASKLAGAFIEGVRNIPLLLFVFFWYFGIIRALPPPRSGMNAFDLIFLNNRGLAVPAPESWLPFLAVPAALALGTASFLLLRRWARRRQEATGQPFALVEAGVLLMLLAPVLAAIGAGLAVGWNVPALRGFNVGGGIVLIPEFIALLAALVTYTAGFIAEIVRGGILAVADGQRQAARALGLSEGQTLRLVVIPQAMRVIVPPLTNQYVNLVKNSSFAAAIAYPDIVSVWVGSALNQTGQAIEIIAMTLAIYLVLSLAVSALMNWYNRAVALPTR